LAISHAFSCYFLASFLLLYFLAHKVLIRRRDLPTLPDLPAPAVIRALANTPLVLVNYTLVLVNYTLVLVNYTPSAPAHTPRV
jgi:hypothetical protein